MVRPRTAEFRKNIRLEQLLTVLNSGLQEFKPLLSEEAISRGKTPLLIMGTPRSGTTLTTQLLAQTKIFAYPSNLSSRFYANPFVGSVVHQMLSNPGLGFKDEMNLLCSTEDFHFSDLGKTSGPLSINVFWYFWRHCFGIPIESMNSAVLPSHVNERSLEKVALGLAGISHAWGDKPVMLKGMILNWVGATEKETLALMPMGF